MTPLETVNQAMLSGLSTDGLTADINRTQPLYHYTSAEGLLGILRSQELHASNYAFMNDTTEMVYGANLARPILSEEFGKQHGLTGKILKRALEIIAATRGMDIFIFSLCEHPDVLSQWRGYGSAASRYAIGFDRQQLIGMSQKAIVPLRVIYDSSAQEEKVRHFCASVASILATSDLPDEAEIVDKVAIMIAIRFFHLLPLLKNKGFQEECEWRLVVTTYEQPTVMDFVVRGGMLRPFFPIRADSTITSLPIREVIVGYSPHPDRAVRSVEMLLKHYGHNVPVSITNIPFTE